MSYIKDTIKFYEEKGIGNWIEEENEEGAGATSILREDDFLTLTLIIGIPVSDPAHPFTGFQLNYRKFNLSVIDLACSDETATSEESFQYYEKTLQKIEEFLK